jgi:hypothetical protein
VIVKNRFSFELQERELPGGWRPVSRKADTPAKPIEKQHNWIILLI